MRLLDRMANRLGYEPKSDGSVELAERKMSRAAAADTMDFEQTYGVEESAITPSAIDLLRTASTSDWIYRAVSAIADGLSSVPLRVYKIKGTRTDRKLDEVVDKGPLVDLLDKPFMAYSGEELVAAMMGHGALTGNAYAQLTPTAGPDSKLGPRNLPVEIIPIRPDRTRVLPHKTDYIAGYVYTSGVGKPIKYTHDEVVHFKYLQDPLNEYYGLAPTRAACNAITMDLYATAFNLNFYANSAEPGGILQTERTLSEDVVKRVALAWKHAHEGIKKAWRVAILGDGFKWQQTGVNAKDMQFLEQQKFSGERMGRAFGVPPLFMGVLEYANYSLAIQQERILWTQTLIPKGRRLCAIFNRTFVPWFGSDLYVAFDTSEVEALHESENERATRAVQLVGSNIWTVNEVRERYWQMPPVSWGDEPQAAAGLPSIQFEAAIPSAQKSQREIRAMADDTEDD